MRKFFHLTTEEKARAQELLATYPEVRVVIFRRHMKSVFIRFVIIEGVCLAVACAAYMANRETQPKVLAEACLGDLNEDGSYINK